MLSGRGELVADEAHPQEPGAKVYRSFSLTVLIRLAECWFNAWAVMAKESWMYAFIFPACSTVELYNLYSIVPFRNTLCRFTPL